MCDFSSSSFPLVSWLHIVPRYRKIPHFDLFWITFPVIKILFWDSLACSLLHSIRICKKILARWKFRITDFIQTSWKISLSVRKFQKFTARPFNSQRKAKTASYRAHETTCGKIGAVRIRPDLINLCHGEVGVCKTYPFCRKLVPPALRCLIFVCGFRRKIIIYLHFKGCISRPFFTR